MLTDEPAFDADDAPLPEGEVVTAAMPTGTRITLRFVSPFEPWLTLGGRRVVADRGGESRQVWLWLGRRLAALYRALEGQGARRGLRATLTSAGVIVTDLVGLDDDVSVDHGTLAAALEGARVKLPTFAALGGSLTRGEILARARALYAAGTPLEVRVEDQAKVLGRRLLRVGRG